MGPWHPGRIDPQRRQHLRRPVACRQVEQERAGAIRLVEGVSAGQPEPDVVLRQQDVRDPRPDVRFVVADPDELGRREAGQGVIAGDLDEPFRTHRPADLVARVGGPLVVPQDRRPQDPVGVIEQDRAVHLAGQPDRRRRSDPATPLDGEHGSGSRLTVPSHHRAGSCSLQSGRGTS